MLKNNGYNAHSKIATPKGAVGTAFLSAPLPDIETLYRAYEKKQTMTYYLEFKVMSVQHDKITD